MPTITVEYLAGLAEHLSVAERARLRGVLGQLDTPLVYHQQRQRNQVALEALEALFFQTPPDPTADDTWWSAFAEGLNTQRTANRPLYPSSEGQRDAADCA